MKLDQIFYYIFYLFRRLYPTDLNPAKDLIK